MFERAKESPTQQYGEHRREDQKDQGNSSLIDA
jgi:hypothetical protein